MSAWSAFALAVFLHLVSAKSSEDNAIMLKLLKQVVERVQQDETGVHDVLWIDCNDSSCEDLLVAFHKQHPMLPMKILQSTEAGLELVDNQPALYRGSLVLVFCSFYGKCTNEQMQASPAVNKYAVHFQIFTTACSDDALEHAMVVARSYGLTKVVQVKYASDASRISVRCGGALLTRTYVLPASDIPEILFNGSLNRLDSFIYQVSIAPLSSNAFIKNRTICGFEVDVFLTIVQNQRAKYRFHWIKPVQTPKVVMALHDGTMDVLLNNLQTDSRLHIERAIWQEYRAYCIMMPKTLQRAHLQLLLHPFEWYIWLVLIGVLLFVQLLNVLLPNRFCHNFIMMCFFGSGPSEHELGTMERMLLCAICIIIFLLTETYQAILLSLITVDPYIKNPDTIEEFLARNITVNIIRGLYHMIPEKLYPVAKVVSSTPLFYSFSHATLQPCADVFFWNANPLKLNLPTKEELITVRQPVFHYPSFVAFSQLSPATRAYQTGMNRLFETGIYQYFQQKWFPEKIFLEKESTFNDSIVLTEDLVPVWELFGVGLMISALIFLCEWTHFYFKLRCSRNSGMVYA